MADFPEFRTIRALVARLLVSASQRAAGDFSPRDGADKVDKKIETVKNLLEAWRTLAVDGPESKTSEALLRMLSDHPDEVIVSWDRTGNALLAIAAISDRRNRPTRLAEAMQQVRVPPGYSSPKHFLVEQRKAPDGLPAVWSVDEWKARLHALAERFRP